MAEAAVTQEQLQLDKMAYRSVLKPILTKLDKEGGGVTSGAAVLGDALEMAESYYPGLSSHLVEGILLEAGCRSQINMLAAYLLLEREENAVRRRSTVPLHREAEGKAIRFKTALGSIPLRIQDVKTYNVFLNREVARPMNLFLTALSNLISGEGHAAHTKLQELQQMKRDFVSLSKQLVHKSKVYLEERDSSKSADRQQAILLVANKLVHLTNIILESLE